MPDPVATAETSNNNTSEQQSAREEVQKKYEEHYGSPAQAAPVEEQPQVEEPKVEPEKPPSVEELLAKVVSPLVERMQAIEARMTAPAPTPVAEPKPATPEKKLIDYLREGDVDGFEAALVSRVEAKVRPEVAQESVTEAVARVRAESDIRSFVDKVQSENTDLAPMQGWIVAEAAQLIEASREKIKSYDDYVAAYKDAVTKAVDTVRKAALTIRGSGKSEGMTARKEVLHSGVIGPNSPNANAEQNRQVEKQPESAMDYIARRQAGHFAGRGGAV